MTRILGDNAETANLRDRLHGHRHTRPADTRRDGGDCCLHHLATALHHRDGPASPATDHSTVSNIGAPPTKSHGSVHRHNIAVLQRTVRWERVDQTLIHRNTAGCRERTIASIESIEWQHLQCTLGARGSNHPSHNGGKRFRSGANDRISKRRINGAARDQRCSTDGRDFIGHSEFHLPTAAHAWTPRTWGSG
jgi:hypothetical protein